MGRNYDWSPLGRDSDPIPGDPEAVWDAVTSLESTVKAIEAAVNGIKKVSDGDLSDLGESEAIDAFTEKAQDVADKLNKAKPRYEVAAKAMKSYYYALDDAQAHSVSALHDAENAQSDQSSAESSEDGSQPGPTEPGFENSPLGLANQALKDAKAKLEKAIGDRDGSAEQAKKDIHNKIEDDEVKDSFWDNMSGFADLLSNISTVLGVLALVVNFIPVIGQALSVLLGALALITGALALILHLGAALDNGEGWDAVIFDAIGVATFGIGRAFNAGAKGLSMASRTMAWGKLSRMGGPIASKLNSGAFAFVAKGSMTKGMAAQIAKSGPLTQGKFAAAFGNIGGDISSSWRTIKAGGFSGAMGNLADTPGNVVNAFRSMDGFSDLPRLLQGENALSKSLDDIANLGEFTVPQIDNALNLANQAEMWSTAANGAFGLGSAGTLADNLGVDIPFVP